jgi:lipopolysaccharide/colanic/teichoic acid biosynthesis glycosyltransferase
LALTNVSILALFRIFLAYEENVGDTSTSTFNHPHERAAALEADLTMRGLAVPSLAGRFQRSTSNPLGGPVKRAFDILFASSALLLLSPLMLLVALLVRLDSPGPILFRQRRTGYRGRPFLIFKFRSMVTTENGDRIQQARINDARVSSFGRFLRRSSIDELPQLLNVLFGDMSMIGPRPHPIALERERLNAHPYYCRRQKARPGITGLAQISGSRGALNTSAEIAERLRLDLEYVNTWSLARDIAILARTVGLVLRRKL